MAVEGTVEEEVKHAARFGFPAVRFDCMDDIVGCDRAELDVNFTDDADSRTARAVVERQAVEVLDDIGKVFLVLAEGFTLEDGFAAAVLPVAAEDFRAARCQFIRTCAVEALLQGIAVNDCLYKVRCQGQRELEARLRFKALCVQGNDRNLGQACFIKRLVDESDIVRSTAHAARLGHHERDIRADRGKDFDIIAGSPCSSLDDREVDRGHFRNEDRVILVVLHFLGKLSLRIMDFRHMIAVLDSFLDSGLQRTETDTDSAEVQALVDLEAGVETVSLAHDFLYLIGNDGIKAAAEGVQFDELKIRMACDVFSCLVQTAVPGPLVHDTQIREFAAHHGYAVFGKDSHAQLVDEVRNRMVDRRVDMVRTACQHDADQVLVMDFLQDAFCLIAERFPVCLFRHFACIHGSFEFIAGNAHRLEEFFQAAVELLGRMERKERMVECSLIFGEDFVHIGLDVFRIRSDHRAVVAVRAAFDRAFVDARVPDEIRMVLGKVIDMRMGKLGREAFGIRRNRFHRFGRDVTQLFAGCDDTVAELREESMPVREIFVHVHRTRNADGASLGLARCQGLPVPDLVVLPAVNIRERGMWCALAGQHDSGASLAAVAGNEGTSVAEAGNRNHAVVAAARAAFHFIRE